MDVIDLAHIKAYLARGRPAQWEQQNDGDHLYSPHALWHPFSEREHLARISPHVQQGHESVVIEFYTRFNVQRGVTQRGVSAIEANQPPEGAWQITRTDLLDKGFFLGYACADFSVFLPLDVVLTKAFRESLRS